MATVASQQSAPPAVPSRPPHPLFAGAGAKNALAAAAANMEKKRAEKPSEDSSPPSRPVSAAPIASSAPSSRPVHPLFGGGGGGDGGKSALNDQIKLMAAKRNERVREEGVKQPPERPEQKKSIDAVMPPHSSKSGGNTQTASMAEQVAMLAAMRSKRLSEEGAEPVISTKNDVAQQANVIPAPAPAPRGPPPGAKKTVTSSTTESKRKGLFGKKETVTKTTTKTTIPAPTVQKVPATPKQTIPVEEKKPPSFTQAQLRKSSPTPTSTAAASSSVPVFSQQKLKKTGLREDSVDEAPEQPAGASESSTPAAPSKVPTMATSTTTTTHTEGPRLVTKDDPDNKVTEYKVGCLCTIL